MLGPEYLGKRSTIQRTKRDVFSFKELTEAENSIENSKPVIHEEKANKDGEFRERENLAEVHFPCCCFLVPNSEINGQ